MFKMQLRTFQSGVGSLIAPHPTKVTYVEYTSLL